MIFERKKYLDELIAGRGNGLVKIITGVRRCGKSFLLFDIWHNWLLEHGVTDSHIIEIQLDDFRNRRLRKPDALLDYIDSKVVDDGKPYYIVLDEVQLVEEFVEVILSLTHMRNVDVYVSGSNSRFLSSDVVTEFKLISSILFRSTSHIPCMFIIIKTIVFRQHLNPSFQKSLFQRCTCIAR